MSRWKQGDTLPPMVIDTFDGAGLRPNLTTATEVKVIVNNRGVLRWQRIVPGTANGVVTVPLLPTDTDTVGTFSVKVKVTWPDGKFQHYPPADEWMTMTVTR